jgi:hypothetical protein
MMSSPRQVAVFLPTGRPNNVNPLAPSAYPSLAEMRLNSKLICAVMKGRNIELVERGWNGSVADLPQDERCLVHYTCTLPGKNTLIEFCDRHGHLLFCSDRIYNGHESNPARAVEQWLDEWLGSLNLA